MRKGIISLLFIVVTHVCVSQKVYFNPNDYKENTGLVFAKLKVGPKYLNTELSGNIKVIDTQGNKLKIKKDSVWGYESKNGKVYRLYRDNSIEVVDNGNLVIYKFSSLYWDSYFFSTSLSSEIYRLNKRNLVKQSINKDCLNEVLNKLDSMNKRIKSRKDNSSRFYINDIIDDMNCNPFN